MNELNTTEMMIAYMDIIKKVHQKAFQSSDKQSKETGPKIHPRQLMFLSLVNQNEGISQKELAERNITKPASISGMLQRLEQQGLITRMSDPEDRRILRVYLTPVGKELNQACVEKLNDWAGLMFGNFTQEEKQYFWKIIEKIDNNIEQVLEVEKIEETRL